MSTVLETINLTKRFGRFTAVDHVSMHIQKGDIYGFVGQNGAGKTTLMRMVLHLANPSEGAVHLFGGVPYTQAGQRIGSLVETPGFYKNTSAKENLKRFAIIKNAKEEDIMEILNLVGLGNTGSLPVGKFSLGMKQRLGIAIALLGRPAFLVLDEPVNGLDPAGMKEIRDLLLFLNQRRGITILISSHLLSELSKLATRYGIIHQGRLIDEFDASTLEANTRATLKITVSDPNAAAAILYPHVAPGSLSLQGQSLLLADKVDQAAYFNQLLNQNGLLVSSLELQPEDIEHYFLERIGGVQ